MIPTTDGYARDPRLEPTATIRVADIGLDSRTAGAQAVYTYQVPDGRQVTPGEACYVSLGPRRAIGFVLDVREVTEAQLGFETDRLKPIGSSIKGLALPPHTLELVKETARQTLTPVAVALSLAVPPAVRDRLVTSWELVAEYPDTGNLTVAQHETVRVLKGQGTLFDSKAKPLPDGAKSSLRALERRGVVRQDVALEPQIERRRLTGLYHLTSDEAKVEKFLSGLGKKRPAQAVTLMRLQGSESASFTVQEIKSLGGVTDQTIKALVDAGLLVSGEELNRPLALHKEPNAHQQAAIEAITASIKESEHTEFLLFGVTGSGKTEVYLRCAAEALRLGRQILYLVPEIALTAQVIAQLRERFGNLVAVFHSNMAPSERLENWLRVRSGECPVVLGARSAVFAPLSNIGLIVVDEEHEASYKQESSPRYQTKSLASFLGQTFSCPVVFGSATPSIESFYAAQTRRLRLLRLPDRAASARLPEVQIVDLATLYRERRASVLSPQLHELLESALSRGEQAILFLNRRAYSPFLLCRDCGHRFRCRQCAVSLAFHRRDRKLRCHQCGWQEDVPETCPHCASDRVAPFGTGTEKVEEAVQALFPGVAIARLDRDVARKKGALEEILAQFRSGALQILVGTQMVAKGLDFPKVTVVGVVAADISLNVPDFRASERTYQLLSQVAGRAGRGTSPGVVVIQTMSPAEPSILTAKSHDYEAFYHAELQNRQHANYPPFRKLANVLLTSADRQAVVGLSAVLAQKLRLNLEEVSILGPADCPIERIQNLWRRHILLKFESDACLEVVRRLVDESRTSKVRIVVDVDPASLV